MWMRCRWREEVAGDWYPARSACSGRRLSGTTKAGRQSLLLLPGLERLAKLHQLSQVVGVVIGHQQRLAHQGLSLAAGQRLEQWAMAVEDECAHLLDEVDNRPHRLLPSLFLWRRG